MKRRTLKKQIPQLARRLFPVVRKYLAAGERVHQDVIYGYQREIELFVVELMSVHLTLDRAWPHQNRWLDGLSDDFSWEVQSPLIHGSGELFWGHWPEVGRNITGIRFTVELRLCLRHGVEYRLSLGDVNDVREYLTRKWC